MSANILNIIKLFFEFLKIGAFSFGGGLSTLPYIYEMSRKTAWIEEREITNILTLSQITPGPLACNLGTIIGLKTNGILASIVANIAFVIPAIIFMGIGYKIFNKIKDNKKANEIIQIIRSAALAILITSSISIFKRAFFNEIQIMELKDLFFIINIKSVILGLVIYFVQKYKKINSILLMFISAVLAGFFRI